MLQTNRSRAVEEQSVLGASDLGPQGACQGTRLWNKAHVRLVWDSLRQAAWSALEESVTHTGALASVICATLESIVRVVVSLLRTPVSGMYIDVPAMYTSTLTDMAVGSD